MRVLCCLDGTNLESIGRATALLTPAGLSLGVIYVIDKGPHHDIEHTRERFFRPPGPPPRREHQMVEVEQTSAREIIEESLRYLSGAEVLQREGRPEREIVNAAAEWGADLIIICPRAEYKDKHKIGPKSVGHVARFVLDHAPCPVLLVRPSNREQFPLKP
ncbi:MAG: universal stress protein [Chthoniobacterales bacterium]